MIVDIDSKSVNFSISNQNNSYISANTAVTGGLTWKFVGQRIVGSEYLISRCLLTFDITSKSIPADALIESVYLHLRYTGNPSEMDSQFQIIIKIGEPKTYPHHPWEAADYDRTKYTGNGGSINTEDIPDTGIIISTFNINFNSTGKSWIDVSDTDFGIALFSSRDINQNTSTNFEAIGLNFAALPKLYITYFTSSEIPVVGDPTYSDTKATYTKATANVSDAGGGYEERGFEYGLSEGDNMWAVREQGVWGATGDYSLTLPNLLPLTTYYARAYVVNDYGTGFSDWTSFITTDVPAYGIYEESNDPTICFYVRRAGGKWSIKHGPYTEDQADIEIGKILVEGKGKYQIKFTSDVLTGLSVNIMTKLDIRAR